MLVNSKAIVLRTIKYSDSTLIVDAYTEQGGRRGFLVRIPKTRKAPVKNVLFSPMAILNIEWNEHGTSKLTRIKAVQPANIYSDIPFSPAKMAITMFLAEFLSASLRAPMPDRNIFNFIFTSLQWLDNEKGNCANFHIVFLVHLSTYLGLEPNIENCSETSYFDMENGCFTPFRPTTPHAIEPHEARHLPLIMRLKFTTASRIPFTRTQRTRILQAITEYYSIHIPDFPTLKSPEILHELFS